MESYSTNEDTALIVTATAGVLANDTDGDSDPLAASLVSNVPSSAGSVSLNANGSFTFTPATNFNGLTSFQYKANDGSNDSNTATDTILVQAINDAPVANLPPTQTTNEDTAMSFGPAFSNTISASDVDVQGGTLTVTITVTGGDFTIGSSSGLTFTPGGTGAGTHKTTMTFTGTLSTINADLVNSIFTPTPNFNGTATLAMSANDNGYTGGGGFKTDTKSMSVAVAAVDDPPVVTGPGPQSVNGKSNLVFSTANADAIGVSDVDAATAPLAIQLHVSDGTLTLAATTGLTDVLGNGTGSVTFSGSQTDVAGALNGLRYHASNVTATDSLSVQANDQGASGAGGPLTGSKSIPINITAVPNGAPAATDDNYSTVENTALTVSDAANGVLANDTDADGDLLTAALDSTPANGTVDLHPNGTFTYTPNSGFLGTDSFTYHANDGTAGSSSATVFINVTAPPATAVDDAASTTRDTPVGIGVLANDSPPSVWFTGNTAASHGSVTCPISTTGNCLYAPDPGYTGADSFTYTITDGATTSTATVDVSVTDAPADSGLDVFVGYADNLRANAAAFPLPWDGSSNVLFRGESPRGSAWDDGAMRLLNPTGTPVHVDRVVITFPGAERGSFQNFQANLDLWNDFTIDPGKSAVLTATLGDNFDSSEFGPGPCGFPLGADSAPIVTVYVDGTAHSYRDTGRVLDTDGVDPPLCTGDNESHAWIPIGTADGNGNATLTLAPDSQARDRGAQATLTAHLVDAGGVAIPDEPITFTASDSSPNAGELGTVNTDAAGDAVLHYTSTVGGTDSDVASVSTLAGSFDSNAASVTWSNQRPVASPDSYDVQENATLDVPAPGVLENDTDPDSDPLTASLVAGPAHGTLFINSDGSFTYTPDTGYSGLDSFTYDAEDGIDASDAATVSITVTPRTTNTAPVAADDSYSVNVGNVLDVGAPGVLGNDTDDDDDPLTAALVTGAEHGTLAFNSDGSFVYTPNDGFTGSDSFTYEASDGIDPSNVATVSIAVNTPGPTLSLTKQASANPVEPGAQFSYSIVVGDNGPGAATGVKVTDPLPANVDYVSSTATQGGCAEDSHIVTCDIGDLAESATAMVTVVVKAPFEVANLSNTATASSNETSPIDASAATDVRSSRNGVQPFTTVRNTDFVDAGFGGMRGGDGTGTLTVSGVTGPVKRALLYWQGPTNTTDAAANSNVSFAGHAIAGANIGFSSDNCWGFENSQAYRADVTPYVSGNGTYDLASFIKATPAADINGVSLIVFFDDGIAANNRDVVLFNGNDSNIENPYDAAGWDVNLSGINYSAGAAALRLHVGDGQQFADDALVVNGATIVPGGEVFDGDSVPNGPNDHSGGLWDIKSFDVTSLLSPGPNTLHLTTGVNNDCLSLVVATVDLPAGSAPPTTDVSIDDAHVTEGDSGTTDAVFTITRSGPTTDTSHVDFTTADGTATTANADYAPSSGSLTFAPGETTKTITVHVNGDTSVEPDETFFVNLSSTDANVVDDQGVATIENDDASGPDLQLTKTASAGSVGVGDLLTYTLKVHNVGPGTAHAVNLTDTLPSGVKFESVTTTQGSCSGTDTVTCDLGSVDTGAANDVTVTISIRPNGAAVGTITNHASVSGFEPDPDTTNNSASVATTVTPPVEPPPTQCFSYPNFSATSGITLLNSADQFGNMLRLTPAQGGLQGQAWYARQVNVNDFETNFDFQLTDQGGIAGADGLTFTIQNKGVDAVGGIGGGLGYDQLEDSLTVEFDTFDNGLGAGDPNDNHVAVHSGGTGPNGPGDASTTQLGVAELTPVLKDGQVHHARIAYHGGNISVFVDDMSLPALVVPVDIATKLALTGGKAYIGFTSATGAGYENHDVLDWSYCNAPPETAPTVDAGPNATINAGAAFTSSGSFTDPDADTWAATVDYGDGTGPQPLALAPGKTFSLDHTYDAGGTYTVTVTVSDGHAVGTDTAVVTVDSATAPVAHDDAYSTNEDTLLHIDVPGILGNDSGSGLSAVLVGDTSHGHLTLNSDGSFTYVPEADFNGSDSFTYKANDGSQDSNVATVSIGVDAVNDSPDCASNAFDYFATEDTPLSSRLVCDDVDGDSLHYGLAPGFGPSHGTLTVNDDGTFDYTPEPDFNGIDSFKFAVADGHGGTSEGIVTLYVDAVNDSPVANPDSASTTEDTAVTTGNVLANDTPGGGADESGQTLSVTGLTQPAHGTVVDDGDGTFTYTPAADFNGTDTFTYTVSDDGVPPAAATGTVTITVAPVNDQPSLSPFGNITIDEGSTSLPIDLDPHWADVETPAADATFTAVAADTSGSPSLLASLLGHSLTVSGGDDGTGTVTVTGTDTGDGASAPLSATRSFDVTVANVAPTVAAPADQTANTGESKSFTLGSFTDPGLFDNPWSVVVDWGDGSSADSFTRGTAGSLGSFDHTFASSGPKTVTITVTDKDGGVGSATFKVDVANESPALTPPSDQSADEGTPHLFDLGSFTDANNDGPWTVEVDWNYGGVFSAGSTFSSAATGALSATHTYADGPSTHTVAVRVTDEAGGFDLKTFTVSVGNVAPSVTPPSDQTAAEGSPAAIDLGSFTDPAGAADGPYAVGVDWGDGSPSSSSSQAGTGSLAGLSHTYDDGPHDYTATVTVTDKDGGSDSATFTVHVTNVDPTATFAAASAVDEGQSFTLSLTSPNDRSAADTAAGFLYRFDCGDGSGFGALGSLGSTSCPTAQSGVRHVRGKIVDKDGGQTTYAADVTVRNLAPVVTAAANQTAAEGASTSFTLGSFTDAAGNLDAPFHVSVDWGDGSEATTFDAASVGTLGSRSHTFADGPHSYTVAVSVADADGGTGHASFTVAVTNVAPALTAPADQAVDEGISTSFELGSFTDPGADSPWTVDVNWGDGSPASHLTRDPGPIQANHTYADGPGASPYLVSVTVTDKDGGADTKTFHVNVNNVAPTATFNSPFSVDEGKSFSIGVTNLSDVAADLNGILVALDCGSGYTAFGTATQRSCPGAPDNGSIGVGAKLKDKDGGIREYRATVLVANVAPRVTITGPANGTTFAPNAPITVSGNFLDVPADTQTVGASFGAGGPLTLGTVNAAARTWSVSLPAGLPAAGTYTITVFMTDDDGAAGTARVTIKVA